MSRNPTFRQRVEMIAKAALSEALPPSQVAQAVARVALAFAAAHRTARDPAALEACTDASIGSCIALSALTGLMPGGSHALVYLVPQAARRGEAPELQWRPTHRGYAALALEDAGLVLLPVAVFENDELEVSFGEASHHQSYDQQGEVIGVYVTIRRAADGVVLSRPWLPRRKIDEIAERSDSLKADKRKGNSYSPWTTSFEEMALAAAIRWCHGRGMIPSSSTRLQNAMVEEVTTEAAQVAAVQRPARIASRQPAPETRQIDTVPDYDEQPDTEREHVNAERAEGDEEVAP